MNSTSVTYILMPIASNQVEFFLHVAQELRRAQVPVKFFNFYEPGDSAILKQGFSLISFWKQWKKDVRELTYSEEKLNSLLETLAIHDVHKLLAHEALNFQEPYEALKEKLYYYLSSTLALLKPAVSSEKCFLIQEFGGFMSNIAAFHVSKALHVPHYFIEPSFFKGTIFLLKNTFNSVNPTEVPAPNLAAITQTKDYIEKITQLKSINIPNKDKHFYQKSFAKFFKLSNVCKLLRKIHVKFILREREEFSYIYVHVKKNFKAIIASQILKKCYKPIPTKKFIYFPFHVPGDVALTIRSAAYLDQLALVDYLARIVPNDYDLCLKEHPAMLGAFCVKQLTTLLKKYSHVQLLNPSINNFDVIHKAAIVLTINSKSGAEAICLGKKVICLGDAFYSHCAWANSTGLNDLQQKIVDMLKTSPQINLAEVIEHFAKIYALSLPGELYDNTQENVLTFTQSLKTLQNAH
jgi:hypothetical protein